MGDKGAVERDASEGRLWRSRIALVIIVDALASDPAFLERVASVRSAPDRHVAAWEEARAYGIGERRRFIAALLARAAEYDELGPDEQELLSNVGDVASRVRDDPRRSRRSTYLISEPFLKALEHSAAMLVRKGHGESLSPADERSIRRAIGMILAHFRLPG